MSKYKIQTKYFIKGTLAFYSAIFSITVLPGLVHGYFKSTLENYFFSELELLFLVAAAVFYLFAPKYYRWQWLVVLSGFGVYFLFREFYQYIF